MRLAFFLLASFLSLGALAKSNEWHTIGSGAKAQYDVLKSSVEIDADAFLVQFVLRTTYIAPSEPNGARTFVEQTLVLCDEDLLITMNQLAYNEKGEHIGTVTRATVYPNPGQSGQVITEMIRWACGTHKPSPNVTPVPKQSPGISV